MSKTVKIGSTLSKILLSVVDKRDCLGGGVCTKILSDPQQFGLQVGNFKEEGNFSSNTQLSERQELLRSSRNLNRKMTPRHGKTLWPPPFARSYLPDPSLALRKSETLRKRVSQAFRGHQDCQKPTLGTMSTRAGKSTKIRRIC